VPIVRHMFTQDTLGDMYTNNDALAGQLVCQVHLVTGRTLDEVDIGQLVADLDECRCRGVEETSTGEWTR
jgi:hypothetical protein